MSQDTIYQLAFGLGTAIAVVIAYLRKPSDAGKQQPAQVSSVVAGVGVGFQSREAEERREAMAVREVEAMESIAESLVVLADRERHETQERLDAIQTALLKLADVK